jgi:PilZ domain
MEERREDERRQDERHDDRRRSLRHRTFKAGTIAFSRAGGFDCRVRNISAAGACLEVASQIGIPDDFVLVVESDHVKQPCHVVWRTATRLGVEFRSGE